MTQMSALTHNNNHLNGAAASLAPLQVDRTTKDWCNSPPEPVRGNGGKAQPVMQAGKARQQFMNRLRLFSGTSNPVSLHDENSEDNISDGKISPTQIPMQRQEYRSS